MKGIKYLTNDKGSKTALLIDLKQHDKRLNSSLEDMLDIIESERLKDEPTVSFELAMKHLFQKGRISKKVYDKVSHGL